MKKTTLLLFIIALSSFHAFSQWQWQNPEPQGNWQNYITFVDNYTGYIVANCGTVLKTTNAGDTWSLQNYLTRKDLYGCDFISANTGYVVGDSGTILKTYNGGNNWLDISQSITNTLFSVKFFNVDTGFIAGDHGIILKTVDGGNTWITQQITSTSNSLRSMYFVNQDTGYVVGYPEVIYRTIDGGNTWTQQTSAFVGELHKVFFANGLTGFISGYNGIQKTIDGGANWNEISPIGIQNTFSTYFVNENTGYCCGDGNTGIRKTTDGGNTWTIVKSTANYTSLFFFNDSTGICINGLPSGIYKTIDGGQNWDNKISGSVHNLINSLYFTDNLHGYAACWYGVMKTSDGGNNWSYDTIVNNNFIQFHSIFFANPFVGYVVGNYGMIYKTRDAGQTWINKSFSTANDYQSVFFINADTGFVVGMGGIVYKTTDGADSWLQILNNSGHHTSIFFVNDSVGYISGYYSGGTSLILKTLDGGDTWQNLSVPWQYYIPYLGSVYFIDNNYGFASGTDCILKTTDGGNTWLYNQLTMDNRYFCSVRFYDYNNGYTICNNYGGVNNGNIFKTNDGGVSWIKQEPITDNALSSIFLTDTSHIWVGGDYGTIIAKIDSSGIITDISAPDKNSNRLNIFPNPGNEYITLERTCTGKDDIISIFNFQGQLLFRKQTKNEKTEIDISDFSSGVYIIRVQTDSGIKTKKFIKE